MKRDNSFKTWINRKWAEWDAQTGSRSTQQDLADYLGITRQALSHYVSGLKTPGGENLRKISRKFGNEVYEVVGAKPPDDDPYSALPPEHAGRLRSAISEIERTLNRMGLDPRSEEAKEESRRIFMEHGFVLNDTTILEED